MIPRKNTAKDLWKPKRRIELLYKKSVRQIMRKLEKKLNGLTSIRDILKAIKKFIDSPEFNEHADRAAMKMVTSVFSDAGKTWREAARTNSKGKPIYEALKNEMNTPIGLSVREQVERNSKLIKSMPKSIRAEITNHVAEETLKGRRSEYIAEDLQKMYPHMFESKAKLIARTEVSKTSTALTKARCENLGLNWYIWRTSEDQRVRGSHSHMDDVLVCWDNPPSPEKLIGVKSTLGYYHAGNCPNCRCYPEPVVRLDFVSWPHKVYYKGIIVNMTRKQFEAIAA
jgi:SPP1 gp7 family putative phage head morphogenesis protein